MDTTRWLIVSIAAIGFAFDIYELLMLPLIIGPALQELGGLQPGSPAYLNWVSLLFFVPAFVGGVFGLFGGYLTDRLGRRRMLVASILLYAFSAFAAGFATNLTMLLVLRCLVFVGVCVEFVAAVAWLAELFPNPRQREKVLGYTQAFSSIGGLMVAWANGLAIAYQNDLPAIAMPEFLTGLFGSIPPEHAHSPWRYTLMSGLIPAIPLIVIRPFLPESPQWEAKRQAGTLKRPSVAAIFAPQLRQTTLVTTIMFACSYGAAFGAIQQIQRIVPGLPQVQAKTAPLYAESAQLREANNDKAAIAKVREAKTIEQKIAAEVTKVQEYGGLAGRFVLAFLAVLIVSRRMLLRLFLIPGLVVMVLVFGYVATTSLDWLYVGMFLAGLFTVAQFSFWGNYLPRVYPVHLRGTGEGFAANIGGRIVGTSMAAVAVQLSAVMPGSDPAHQLAYAAAVIAGLVYCINLLMTFALPEPPAADEPEA
jgi:MFS family permease